VKKVHARFGESLLLAVALALGASAPTSAARPETSTFLMQGTQLLADCGDFLVYDDYDATVGVTNFYDKDHNVIAVHMAINGTDTYRQSVTGETITMPSHFMVHFDPQTGLNASAGLVYHLTVPGLGGVFLEVGRSVFDVNAGAFVFLAGPHQLSSNDTAGLCAVFD
jgi:hypothetical protein